MERSYHYREGLLSLNDRFNHSLQCVSLAHSQLYHDQFKKQLVMMKGITQMHVHYVTKPTGETHCAELIEESYHQS